jgi:hypothetical protein
MIHQDSTTERERPGILPVVSTEVAVKPTRRKFSAEYPGLARQGRQVEDPPGNRPMPTRRNRRRAAPVGIVLLPPGRLAQGTGDRPAAGADPAPAGTQTAPSRSGKRTTQEETGPNGTEAGGGGDHPGNPKKAMSAVWNEPAARSRRVSLFPIVEQAAGRVSLSRVLDGLAIPRSLWYRRRKSSTHHPL